MRCYRHMRKNLRSRVKVRSPVHYLLLRVNISARSIVDELKVGADQIDYDPAAPEKNKAEAISLAWSADGQTLFVGYTDDIVRVWSVSS